MNTPLMVRLDIDNMRQSMTRAILDHNHDIDKMIEAQVAEACSEENFTKILKQQLECILQTLINKKVEYLVRDTLEDAEIRAAITDKIKFELSKGNPQPKEKV